MLCGLPAATPPASAVATPNTAVHSSVHCAVSQSWQQVFHFQPVKLAKISTSSDPAAAAARGESTNGLVTKEVGKKRKVVKWLCGVLYSAVKDLFALQGH